MIKSALFVSVCCALAALSRGQDMTSMMFQAMGVELPPMPPTMPRSLQEHLYPQQRQRQQQQQQLQRLQQQRMVAIRTLQQRQQQLQQKQNPYSTPYRSAYQKQNSVISPANAIRRPGAPTNALLRKAPANPYSMSRAASSNIATIRNRALAATTNIQRRVRPPGVFKTISSMRMTPKKIKEAKMAGCKLPVDNAAASMMMFSSCRSPTAKMVCQAELMQCMEVGMSAMCCPVWMNRLAMDTITYVNKLQTYVSEVA